MYKDKDKQREANKERQRRYRAERGKKAYPGRDTKGVTDERTYENSVLCEPIAIKGITQIPKEQMCITDDWQAAIDEPSGPKRGKDIKCFEDLPADVQGVIHKLSTIDGKIDQTSKANRTAIAVNYQHQFPNKYYSTGVH